MGGVAFRECGYARPCVSSRKRSGSASGRNQNSSRILLEYKRVFHGK